MTYRHFRRDEVALVEHEQQVLVRCLLPYILFHTPAPCAERVSRIQDMDNHVARINDFVQLVPDPLALTLGKDGLARSAYLPIGNRLGRGVFFAVSDARQ